MQGSTRRAQEGRVHEITEITINLKVLAKDLNVPILALSQMSRQVENRDDKRPQPSDLRESGSIEQDADVVLFVFARHAARHGRRFVVPVIVCYGVRIRPPRL
jgi:replicative DNA helicase